MMREATLPQICCPAEKLPVQIFNANRSDLQIVKHGIDDILSRNLHTSNHNQVGCSSRLGHDLDTDKLVAVRRSHLQCCGSGLQACRQTSFQSHTNLAEQGINNVACVCFARITIAVLHQDRAEDTC